MELSGSAKSVANMICDFTSSSIPQQMLRFSLPFMFSNVLQIVYSLIDMAVVGQYVGKEGRAAVSIASEVCNFMTMSCMGRSTGGQVYISQLIGAGRKKELNRTIGTLFAMIEFFRRYMAWHFCVTADISWPLFPIVFSPHA